MAISLNGTTGITTPGITNTGAETVVDLTTTGNTILGDASGDTLTVTGGTTTFTQGTANGVAFLNGSKVLTTGSALVFDGSRVALGTATSNIQLTTTVNTNQAYISLADADGRTAVFRGPNSGAPNCAQIGTTTNHDLAFIYGGSEQMRLTSTGLGIGTSSPATKLQVNNSANTGNTVSITGLTTATGAAEILATRTGTESASQGLSPSITLGNTSASRYSSISGYQGGFQFFGFDGSAWNERMRLDSSGNLGLGVTPSAWGNGVSLQGSAWSLSTGLGNDDTFLATNARQTAYGGGGSNFVYRSSAAAVNYTQTGGGHHWYVAPSGTAGHAITFTQAMTLDASGNLGIGTSSPNSTLNVVGAQTTFDTNVFGQMLVRSTGAYNATPRAGIVFSVKYNSAGTFTAGGSSIQGYKQNATDGDFGNGLLFTTQANGFAPAERACIDSNGNLLVGATSSSTSDTVAGIYLFASGVVQGTRTSGASGDFGRLVDDGDIVVFRQAGTVEGTISVSGTTVSYNGGHLSRWAQTTAPKDDTLVKGTVLSNLDEMNVYTDVEGNSVDNEQLNKVKVSDVEGDANVAGVFVNWSHDEDHDVDEINMAMTGDMIIRIAQGTTVQRGDLLMSAGDGTAKPQGDDIVRSKTVAKVTSNHVTCTYADGSYCVPCVLMAC